MSTEDNKATAHRVFEEVLNQGNLAVVDELFDASYIGYDPGVPAPIHGVEGYKQYVRMYSTAFPDAHYTIEDMIAEGDKVVVRWTARGTHQGAFRGIPPTGKQVTITGVEIHRVVGGKIVEGWRKWDRMDVMQQLGVTDIALYRADA